MNRSPSALDLVQVASPCHVSWDQMAGDERNRFCKQCNLHVYNLSDMPREEAERFVSQAEGRTCIRFFRREDGTVLKRDCPVGLRAARQRFVRAVAALAGMLAALVTGTLFAGRVKNTPEIGRPSTTYAEWIKPGSTQSFALGIMELTTIRVMNEAELDTILNTQSPESSLPEPSAKQSQ